jgi:hypothetical protein
MEYVFSSVQGVAQCFGDLAAINCMDMPYRLSEKYPHILIGKSRRGYVYTMDSGAQHILIGKSRRGYIYTIYGFSCAAGKAPYLNRKRLGEHIVFGS